MARRDYGEIGKLIGASAKTVEGVYGHDHPDYLKAATETLNFHWFNAVIFNKSGRPLWKSRVFVRLLN